MYSTERRDNIVDGERKGLIVAGRGQVMRGIQRGSACLSSLENVLQDRIDSGINFWRTPDGVDISETELLSLWIISKNPTLEIV